MLTFLQLVAQSLRQKFGNDFSRIVIVTPNKRARLFLSEYLANGGGVSQPSVIWAPRYVTISELFTSLSPYQIADPIETVCRIHQLYVKFTGATISLDDFYGWGEKILADFEDADKARVDMHKLLVNLSDLKHLDRFDYIDEDMEKALQTFFRDFTVERHSAIREEFLRLWDALLPIYTELNQELCSESLTYEGALYRRVVEGLEKGSINLPPNEQTTYIFVGFNVLSRVEHDLFLYLQRMKRALFYWDYDRYYVDDNRLIEAGLFIRENLHAFPNELPAECFDNLNHIERIEYISTPTEHSGTSFLTQWVHEQLKDPTLTSPRDIAIVLCNESLLQPVIAALPEDVGPVNVTKGYPLAQTPAARIIENAFDLASRRNPSPDVTAFLTHLSEDIQQAAIQHPAPATPRIEDMQLVLNAESYFQAYTIIQRFLLIDSHGFLRVSLPTLHRLIRSVIKSSSIPLHGEPAVGIQVMGLLETRLLSPRRILILSANDANLPGNSTSSTIIPFLLREHFGMPTLRHRTSIHAYYFYRLIQRAEVASITYVAASDAGSNGELSRFLTQIEMESTHTIHHRTITNQPPPAIRPRSAVSKPDDLPSLLTYLSPSAINTYLGCPKQFYYRYVRRIHEPPRKPDVIDLPTFGSIFHRVAETIYAPAGEDKERVIDPTYLRHLLSKEGSPIIDEHILQAFAKYDAKPDTVTSTVIKRYIKRLIEMDCHHDQITILGTEYNVDHKVIVNLEDGNCFPITLRGEIDRLDRVVKDGQELTRIIDYKTGRHDEHSWTDWDELFLPSKTQKHYILQTLYYTSLMHHERPGIALAPALIFIQRTGTEDYDPYLYYNKQRISDFTPYAQEFEGRLSALIREIYDPTLTYTPTPFSEKCAKCPYVDLCASD